MLVMIFVEVEKFVSKVIFKNYVLSVVCIV